jgi:DNA modification methylase
LFTELIELHSLPGETVLDSFSGSASTLLAAASTGRSFVGAELDKGYFEEANQRFKEAVGGWN